MRKVEIFRTDVRNRRQAAKVLRSLEQSYPGYRFNFDLQDKDKICRVETGSAELAVNGIQALINNLGFSCQQLE